MKLGLNQRGRHIALVASAAGLGVLGVAASRDDVTLAPPQVADTFYSLLDARSPGERTGRVVSKKGRPAPPRQSRVKSLLQAPKPGKIAAQAPQAQVAPAETVAQAAPTITSPDAPFQEAVSSLETLPATVQQAALLPPGGGTGGPGGGIIFGPPGGGGGSPGTGAPPDAGPTNPPPLPPTAPPVSAVPEPGTWMMMLLGFGFIGFSMRRRRPAEAGQGGRATGSQV